MRICVSLSVLFVCLLFCTTLQATPIESGEAFNLAFSGQTCSGCWGPQLVPSVNFGGLLTVVPVTAGHFWDPGSVSYISGPLFMVTGLTGTLSIDCLGISGCVGQGTYSMSFVPPNPAGDGWSAPLGDGSFLAFGVPRYLVFSAGGSGLNTRFINDNAYNLFQWASPVTGNGMQVPVTFSTTRVPEVSSLTLLGAGLLAVFAVARKQNRKRDTTEF